VKAREEQRRARGDRVTHRLELKVHGESIARTLVAGGRAAHGRGRSAKKNARFRGDAVRDSERACGQEDTGHNGDANGGTAPRGGGEENMARVIAANSQKAGDGKEEPHQRRRWCG
jgi:hypothetical protein